MYPKLKQFINISHVESAFLKFLLPDASNSLFFVKVWKNYFYIYHLYRLTNKIKEDS